MNEASTAGITGYPLAKKLGYNLTSSKRKLRSKGKANNSKGRPNKKANLKKKNIHQGKKKINFVLRRGKAPKTINPSQVAAEAERTQAEAARRRAEADLAQAQAEATNNRNQRLQEEAARQRAEADLAQAQVEATNNRNQRLQEEAARQRAEADLAQAQVEATNNRNQRLQEEAARQRAEADLAQAQVEATNNRNQRLQEEAARQRAEADLAQAQVEATNNRNQRLQEEAARRRVEVEAGHLRREVNNLRQRETGELRFERQQDEEDFRLQRLLELRRAQAEEAQPGDQPEDAVRNRGLEQIQAIEALLQPRSEIVRQAQPAQDEGQQPLQREGMEAPEEDIVYDDFQRRADAGDTIAIQLLESRRYILDKFSLFNDLGAFRIETHVNNVITGVGEIDLKLKWLKRLAQSIKLWDDEQLLEKANRFRAALDLLQKMEDEDEEMINMLNLHFTSCEQAFEHIKHELYSFTEATNRSLKSQLIPPPNWNWDDPDVLKKIKFNRWTVNTPELETLKEKLGMAQEGNVDILSEDEYNDYTSAIDEIVAEFNRLKNDGIISINHLVDYEVAPQQFTQRTSHLPVDQRETEVAALLRIANGGERYPQEETREAAILRLDNYLGSASTLKQLLMNGQPLTPSLWELNANNGGRRIARRVLIMKEKMFNQDDGSLRVSQDLAKLILSRLAVGGRHCTTRVEEDTSWALGRLTSISLNSGPLNLKEKINIMLEEYKNTIIKQIADETIVDSSPEDGVGIIYKLRKRITQLEAQIARDERNEIIIPDPEPTQQAHQVAGIAKQIGPHIGLFIDAEGFQDNFGNILSRDYDKVKVSVLLTEFYKRFSTKDFADKVTQEISEARAENPNSYIKTNPDIIKYEDFLVPPGRIEYRVRIPGAPPGSEYRVLRADENNVGPGIESFRIPGVPGPQYGTEYREAMQGEYRDDLGEYGGYAFERPHALKLLSSLGLLVFDVD